MDLETENRIAALLMKEAAELRRQAEKEGIHVYLRKPDVRGRPNSRFLTATVLGVQQANRAVEVNEMWKVRQKELELDERIQGRRDRRITGSRESTDPTRSMRHGKTSYDASSNCSSSKRGVEECYSTDYGGFRDEEIEEFLHSRVKRGRGAVGSRMDETGPYPANSHSASSGEVADRVWDEWENRVILGPDKPSFLKSSCESSEEDGWKKAKRDGLATSHKQRSRKQKKKDEMKNRKKKKKEKSSKHSK